jgi:chromosome segregation ATPase
MSAVALEESVATLKSNKAQLTGEIEALNAVKTDAEAKLTAADSRLKVANVKLADFLDRWNNRDKLSADIDALNERVKELKQAEGMTLGNITTLNEQFADLTEKVSTITGSKKNLEANVKALKQTEKELLTSINELQNIRDAASTTDNSEAKSSDDNANPETGEADPKDEEETNE